MNSQGYTCARAAKIGSLTRGCQIATTNIGTLTMVGGQLSPKMSRPQKHVCFREKKKMYVSEKKKKINFEARAEFSHQKEKRRNQLSVESLQQLNPFIVYLSLFFLREKSVQFFKVLQKKSNTIFDIVDQL